MSSRRRRDTFCRSAIRTSVKVGVREFGLDVSNGLLEPAMVSVQLSALQDPETSHAGLESVGSLFCTEAINRIGYLRVKIEHQAGLQTLSLEQPACKPVKARVSPENKIAGELKKQLLESARKVHRKRCGSINKSQTPGSERNRLSDVPEPAQPVDLHQHLKEARCVVRAVCRASDTLRTTFVGSTGSARLISTTASRATSNAGTRGTSLPTVR